MVCIWSIIEGDLNEREFKVKTSTQDMSQNIITCRERERKRKTERLRGKVGGDLRILLFVSIYHHGDM